MSDVHPSPSPPPSPPSPPFHMDAASDEGPLCEAAGPHSDTQYDILDEFIIYSSGEAIPLEQKHHSCSLCEKVFADPTSLNAHKAAIHPAKKKITPKYAVYPCNFCAKVFTSASSKQLHESNGHQDCSFARKVSLIEEYVKLSGKLPVRDTVYKGEHIGRWRDRMCVFMRQGRLLQKQISAIEDIPKWEWRAYSFVERIKLMREYIQEKGDLPTTDTKYRGAHLGIWASTQKSKYKNKTLEYAQIRELESLEGWSWGSSRNTFSETVTLLREYIKKNRHIPSSSYQYLGKWVCNQRYKYKTNGLSPAQVRELESLEGWGWSGTNNTTFSEYIALVREYIHKENALPSADVEYKGTKIGKWLAGKIKLYVQGDIKPHKMQELESLRGWKFARCPDKPSCETEASDEQSCETEAPSEQSCSSNEPSCNPNASNGQICHLEAPICKICAFTGVAHSCTNVMNFNLLKGVPLEVLLKHAQACLRCELHDDFVFYRYWFDYLSKYSTPSPFPDLSCLIDTCTSSYTSYKILSPFRALLCDGKAAHEAFSKLTNVAVKNELIATYKSFSATLLNNYNHLCAKKSDARRYLTLLYILPNA